MLCVCLQIPAFLCYDVTIGRENGGVFYALELLRRKLSNATLDVEQP